MAVEITTDSGGPSWILSNCNWSQHCENCAYGFTGFCTRYNEMTNVCRPETCSSYKMATKKDVDDAVKVFGNTNSRKTPYRSNDTGGVPPIIWLLIVVGIIVAIAYLH